MSPSRCELHRDPSSFSVFVCVCVWVAWCGRPNLNPRGSQLALNKEALNAEFFHFGIMKPAGKFLIVQRKPTVSGVYSESPVGGEILPVNSLQLFLANFWWIFLLAIPLLVYLLAGKYGLRLPRPVRLALRLVPVFYRTLG